MKYTNFNKGNIKSVREQIQKKLDELKALGLEINLKNMRYDSSMVDAKMTITVVGGEDEYASEFKRVAQGFAKPDAVGKTIAFMGKKYIFRGFRPRARKSKALIEDVSTGKLFRVEYNDIVGQL